MNPAMIPSGYKISQIEFLWPLLLCAKTIASTNRIIRSKLTGKLNTDSKHSRIAPCEPRLIGRLNKGTRLLHRSCQLRLTPDGRCSKCGAVV